MAQQNYENLWGYFSDDPDTFTHYLAATYGNGVISGLAVSERGAGANMSVDVAAGEARANGTRRSFGSVTNVTLTAADGSNPRKDLIVINSAGSIIKRDGTPAAATPSASVRRFTLTPAPPELVTGDLVLAEVWVNTSVTQIFDADISSRTILAIEGSDTNPDTLTPDQSIGPGTADDLSRRDHAHGIAAAIAVTTGNANAEGSSSSFARADHVHRVSGLRLLDTQTAAGSQTTITASWAGGANKLYIMFRIPTQSTSGPVIRLRFNSDSGSNYAWKRIEDVTVADSAINDTQMEIAPATSGGGANAGVWIIIEVDNEDTNLTGTTGKRVSWHGACNLFGVGQIPVILSGGGLYAVETSDITSVTISMASGNFWDPEIYVYGSE
ncbi:MAG: hypothetical protein V3W37_08040 [Candidatus Binatia bacterium]